ncbi:MAG: rhodanese-like domain-containing protein [Alphaproteobacteria bacterium]|nr:rhodanese-like domain-containing protein [Alphaproteobacteria bacterium]
MMGRPQVPTETPEEICKALDSGRIVLVDVREPQEFAVERIVGSRLFPLSCFDPAALPREEGKPLVFLCGSGKRSETAATKAISAGLDVRSHMKGGISLWKASGLQTACGDDSLASVRSLK